MDLFSKILVPVDFSACSKNALKEASKLSQKHNGELTVIHIINIITTPTGEITEAKDVIHKNLKTLCEELDIKAESIVEKGVPAEEIVNLISKGKYTLCIMGTNERHGIISELVGTMSLKIIQHASIPVLTIPEKLTLDEVDKIVFATDFKKIKDNAVLNFLRELCLSTNAELHLLNVNESPTIVSKNEDEEALELHRYLSDVSHAFFFNKEKDPVKGIMNYIKKKDIHLLAIMPRKHAFFETLFNDSVTDQIALHLEVPLFSFHE